MSHTPERPKLYVCTGCQSVHAGTVSGGPEDHRYDAPGECAACGSTEFVEMEDYPHFG
ncbi:hypothetical protein C448_06488 [Halococcus morrhuae DSM 1307]|uniref:Small CPxCG-related zinc finger protein n=1 Tax=Halococcus morrhuae DSM 1307 TaxID=931277 RepID=M0ML30_HALMO|nr:hypothetical protein [Halococcus morrhuae]EMA46407.1 hypothetical protein C448_06488 [Halococcus morrhuae DSM 1307]